MLKKIMNGIVRIKKTAAVSHPDEKYQLQIIPAANGIKYRRKGMFFQMGIMSAMFFVVIRVLEKYN
jgi:hypothetical protein